MASSKRIGFYWGEEKITIVEFDKNTPLQIVSSPLNSKAAASSPFSSSLTEEIQITAILQKMLQDNRITGGSFYVSLPMKDIVLRSFIIPFVKPDEIQVAIKFEAKKYMPFDIQELSYVFHTIPFSEGQAKRLQVIFFAVRKEVLVRYERIFKQVNAVVTYCEPYMVSLSKALLFKKEIKATDQFAFLILDQNLGRICFIDQGIPQFIREFALSSPSQSDEAIESVESLNAKIVNEVGNSFDFYARQFSGDRIEQMMVSSDFVQKDLLSALEAEIKVKIIKFSPVVTTGVIAPVNDMDAIYAMGACVTPPIESLSKFNFLGAKSSKPAFSGSLTPILSSYKEIIFVFLICLFIVGGAYLYFQIQLTNTSKNYNQLAAQEGTYLSMPVESIESQTQDNVSKLNQYKDIRVKSDVSSIILLLASHLPQGALLNNLDIRYEANDSVGASLSIDMKGDVFKEDPNEQIAVVNQIFSDLKHDKELARFVKSVNLGSLDREDYNGQHVTGFTIKCS